MSIKGKRKIVASTTLNCVPETVEAKAVTATILPGMVLSLASTGFSESGVAATVFGQKLMVANENEMMQKTVDDLWPINENMVAVEPRPGEAFNVLVAAGNNITARRVALSRSGTAGHLKIALTNGTEEIVAYSDEIINAVAASLVRIVPA